MPNIQSKVAPIEMEETRTINTAIELLTTKMTVEEQQRQQNDCMNLINEYNIPTEVTNYGSLYRYSQLCQFTSAKLIYNKEFLNYDRLAHGNWIAHGSENIERIDTLYDDVVRCVTLETKQILTYIEKQREKCQTKKNSIVRSKTFDLTNINEKLGSDIMLKIKSYIPNQTMVEVYSYHLQKRVLYDKLIEDVSSYNRINLKEIYDITTDIMGKRREQLLLALFRRCVGETRIQEMQVLIQKFKQIFDPVFKNGSTTPRNQYNMRARINAILQVAQNCLSCHHNDEVVKVNIQSAGMDFVDLVNHLYNYSDFKKSHYYIDVIEGNNKKKARTITVSDYEKIKYLREEVGESWKIIACQYGRTSYIAIKRLYEKEKEKEFNEEHKKAREEKRAPYITGFYENAKRNKYFHYIKYGMRNQKHIRKFLTKPLYE